MSENKILCLSWCDADDVVNYGQILQGIAMMHLLREHWDGKITYISYNPRSKRGLVEYVLKHLNPMNGHLTSYIKTRRNIKDAVNSNNINFYQVHSREKMKALSQGCKVALCGSDQLWHPQNYDEDYYLAFAPEEAIKASFAVSIPKLHTEPQYEKQMERASQLLRRFDFISVREKSTVGYISDLSGKEVTAVIDPTFLIPVDVWNGIIEKMDLPQKYIFVYVPNGMNKTLAKCLEVLKESSGISEIYIMQTRGESKFSSGKTLHFISLGQFLYLIDNASYVLTSSFHAVVFSAIFHTEFYCYDVPNAKRGEDMRLTDLTRLLGTENRLIKDGNVEIGIPIEYEKVDLILDREREDSENFLKELLSHA